MESKPMKQVETYVVNMPYSVYIQKFKSQKINMKAICPNMVKKHRVIRGKRLEEGSVERYELNDGSVFEIEFMKMKETKHRLKLNFKVLRSSISGVPSYVEMEDVYEIKPVTYNACPFLQAIKDMQAKKEKEPGIA